VFLHSREYGYLQPGYQQLLLDLWLYVYVLQIVVCSFFIFLLFIVLSVILQFMDSDYILVSLNSS